MGHHHRWLPFVLIFSFVSAVSAVSVVSVVGVFRGFYQDVLKPMSERVVRPEEGVVGKEIY